MHRRLIVIWCHWKMWRRLTINRAADQEQKLSLVDDWSHCYCSWLKMRGVASMGRGRAVFSQKTVQTFPSHLMLYTCSGRSEPSYFIFNALNFPLIMSFSMTSFFISIILFFNHVEHSLCGGTYLLTRYMHDKCMNMQIIWWTRPSRGDIWS